MRYVIKLMLNDKSALMLIYSDWYKIMQHIASLQCIQICERQGVFIQHTFQILYLSPSSKLNDFAV